VRIDRGYIPLLIMIIMRIRSGLIVGLHCDRMISGLVVLLCKPLLHAVLIVMSLGEALWAPR